MGVVGGVHTVMPQTWSSYMPQYAMLGGVQHHGGAKDEQQQHVDGDDNKDIDIDKTLAT
jgi:hypothetical protein